MQAGLTYRRRLEGRALEHGFVTHITGIARDTIRMLRKDEGSSSLTEEPVEGADARAILRAMAQVAAKLLESLFETCSYGWSSVRGAAYADQFVRNGETRANIDLRLKSRLPGEDHQYTCL